MARRAAPTSLKKLRGNPGKRPLPVDEPQLEAVLPEPPPGASLEVRQQWQRVGEQLLNMRVISLPDADALLEYCHNYLLWRKALEMLDIEGHVLETIHGPVINRWFKVCMEISTKMGKFWREFGMTPSSRAGVKAIPKKKTGDDFESKLFGT